MFIINNPEAAVKFAGLLKGAANTRPEMKETTVVPPPQKTLSYVGKDNSTFSVAESASNKS